MSTSQLFMGGGPSSAPQLTPAQVSSHLNPPLQLTTEPLLPQRPRSGRPGVREELLQTQELLPQQNVPAAPNYLQQQMPQGVAAYPGALPSS